MKNFYSFLLVLLAITITPAVHGQSATISSTKYNRASVSFIMLSCPDFEWNDKTIENFLNLDFSNKYDYNPLSIQALDRGEPMGTGDWKDVAQSVEQKLNERNIANEILAHWFQRQANGTLSSDLILERGSYDAKADEKGIAQTLYTNDDILQEQGYELINRSFIVVYDLLSVTPNFTSTGLSYIGSVNIHLYRINYDKDMEARLKAIWLDDNNIATLSSSEVDERRTAFENLPAKIEYITSISADVLPDNSQLMAQGLLAVGNALSGTSKTSTDYKNQYTGDGIAEYAYFIDRMHMVALTQLEKTRQEFTVLTPLTSAHPIEAKIGTKEGLRRGRRYEVIEYTPEGEKRMAYIRASKVAHNTKNANLTSDFGRVSGLSRLEKGMSIKESHDSRLTIFGEFALNPILAESLYDGEDGVFGKMMNINCLGIKIGLEQENFNIRSFTGSLLFDLSYLGADGWGIFEARIGYGFGINLFTPFIKLQPYGMFGFGYDSSLGTSETSDGKSSFLNQLSASYGAKLVFNVAYPHQVYLRWENYIPLNGNPNGVTVAVTSIGYRYTF